MNQRFEDTYDKATDAICGMAKDYRLLEEKNRLLRHRVVLMEDTADIMRNRLSDALARCEHPEYHEARFSLSPSFPPPDVRVIEHEESDIDLAIDKNHNRFVDAKLYGNFFDVIMWRWVFNTVWTKAWPERL